MVATTLCVLLALATPPNPMGDALVRELRAHVQEHDVRGVLRMKHRVLASGDRLALDAYALSLELLDDRAYRTYFLTTFTWEDMPAISAFYVIPGRGVEQGVTALSAIAQDGDARAVRGLLIASYHGQDGEPGEALDAALSSVARTQPRLLLDELLEAAPQVRAYVVRTGCLNRPELLRLRPISVQQAQLMKEIAAHAVSACA